MPIETCMGTAYYYYEIIGLLFISLLIGFVIGAIVEKLREE